MSYNIVLTTAEDVVSVVDAVVAKGSFANKQYITEYGKDMPEVINWEWKDNQYFKSLLIKMLR